MTIDTALESSPGREQSFVETKCSFEVVRARDADQILDLSANALMRRLKRCGAPLLVPALLLLLLGMREPRHRPCCSCGGHRLANIVFHAEI